VRTEDDALFDEVAGGAGLGADEGSVAADDAVEETGFAGVGFTNDHGLDAVAEEFAIVVGGEQAGRST